MTCKKIIIGTQIEDSHHIYNCINLRHIDMDLHLIVPMAILLRSCKFDAGIDKPLHKVSSGERAVSGSTSISC